MLLLPEVSDSAPSDAALGIRGRESFPQACWLKRSTGPGPPVEAEGREAAARRERLSGQRETGSQRVGQWAHSVGFPISQSREC